MCSIPLHLKKGATSFWVITHNQTLHLHKLLWIRTSALFYFSRKIHKDAKGNYAIKNFNFFVQELFVSSESLSTAIEWAVAELIRNQEALSKLREELMEAIEGNIVSESELTNLPFLKACIKETLHPPSPFLLPRCALQTCKVMDYKIPKNSLVLICMCLRTWSRDLGRPSKLQTRTVPWHKYTREEKPLWTFAVWWRQENLCWISVGPKTYSVASCFTSLCIWLVSSSWTWLGQSWKASSIDSKNKKSPTNWVIIESA